MGEPDIGQACGICKYFNLVTERTGLCVEDPETPIYPKVDDYCNCFEVDKEKAFAEYMKMSQEIQPDGYKGGE